MPKLPQTLECAFNVFEKELLKFIRPKVNFQRKPICSWVYLSDHAHPEAIVPIPPP